MTTIYKPWFDLSPNDFTERWWRITEIIDENINPNIDDIMCYFIIQDGNMGGNFWYTASWYLNCPNRYTYTLYKNTWFFDKQMKEISEGDIISLKDKPNIKFKAYNCKHVFKEQIKYCKILERIN